ncbi:MAG: hypothetical protein HY268_08135 [Deltaproteobacteria bacterium]|nr:hypothetical protein [Deltaproteobacteria bacterium]
MAESKQKAPAKLNDIGYIFKGKWFRASSAREVLQSVITLLAENDADFLERFSEYGHGRKRQYIARKKTDLYPGKLHLCEIYSVEFVPGWWLGTNYNPQSIESIIKKACEVAGMRYGLDIIVRLANLRAASFRGSRVS